MLSHFSCVRLYATLRTVACQAPLSMRFSRQEYWSGWPFPSPGHLPDPGIEPASPALQADSLPLSHQGSLCKYHAILYKWLQYAWIFVSGVCVCVCVCEGTNLWWIPRDYTFTTLLCLSFIKKPTHEETCSQHLAFTSGLFLSRVLDI